MGSKTKRKARLNRPPRKAPVCKRPVAVDQPVKKRKSLVQKNPKLVALILIVTYFLLDYLMISKAEDMTTGLIVLFTLLAPSSLYAYYTNDYHREMYPTGGTDVPKFIKNKKKFSLIGWALITLWGIMLLLAEPYVVPKIFPVLDETYHRSQIMLMLYIAPIMEEIVFRYLLYDRWLKRKWGWLGGFLASCLIFVACHPVTNTHSFVIYWVPAVMFYLIYHEFGLYGSIVIHMLYNMMAI